MDLEELRATVRDMRHTGAGIVQRHAAIYARDVPMELVDAIYNALGEISIDEATAALDREQRAHDVEVARFVEEGGNG